MPKQERFKTKYAGVYFIEGTGANGRKERIYYVQYRRNGKLVEEKAGRQFQDDMTPARASQIRADRIQGKAPTNQERRDEAKRTDERWTISKLWASYCEMHPGNKILRAETLKFDHYIKPVLGDKEPAELLALDVDRLRLKLQKAGKLTTAARVLEILRRTVNFGVKRALIPPLPFKIVVPKLNNETTEDLSEDQIHALIEALNSDQDQKAANIMRLALLSGMRRSEIFKLRWDDLDFRKGFIRLTDPKGGKDQTIPMNEQTRAILEGIEPIDGNLFVFPGKKPGSHLTECRVSIDRIRKAAGLPEDFRPLHGLRHVYASMLASSGQVDLYTLQRLLTHKSPTMTMRYAHLRDESLKAASNLAAGIIDEISKLNGNKEREGQR